MKNNNAIRVHVTTLKTGISRTPKFEQKGLATHAISTGLKCDHDCTYCSTGATNRMNKAFTTFQESPFEMGYCIIDPSIPKKVVRDIHKHTNQDLIQMGTTTDFYSPEAQKYSLGRRCLETILTQSDSKVRILTKNAAVEKDFDLISQYRDRVLVGLSITALPEKEHILQVVEPYTSSNSERMRVMQKAHELGLRTYSMFCPLLPGISDFPDQIDQLISFAMKCGSEEIFSESVNPRGKGLIHTQEALKKNGFHTEAEAVGRIRQKAEWSEYTKTLIQNIQNSVRKHFDIRKLRILLYPKSLQPQDKAIIQRDDAGVVCL